MALYKGHPVWVAFSIINTIPREGTNSIREYFFLLQSLKIGSV